MLVKEARALRATPSLQVRIAQLYDAGVSLDDDDDAAASADDVDADALADALEARRALVWFGLVWTRPSGGLTKPDGRRVTRYSRCKNCA